MLSGKRTDSYPVGVAQLKGILGRRQHGTRTHFCPRTASFPSQATTLGPAPSRPFLRPGIWVLTLVPCCALLPCL